jgi:hypothetical protein
MLYDRFTLGEFYTRSAVGNLIDDERVAVSREGLFYAHGTTILFVTLDKTNKDESHRYNDFFEGEFFHWDSQNNQHQRSPKIVEITTHSVEVLLFIRIRDKVRGLTQPFVYAGRLLSSEIDKTTNNPVHLLFEAIDYNPVATGELSEVYLWNPQTKGFPVTTTVSAKAKVSRRAARQGI